MWELPFAANFVNVANVQNRPLISLSSGNILGKGKNLSLQTIPQTASHTCCSTCFASSPRTSSGKLIAFSPIISCRKRRNPKLAAGWAFPAPWWRKQHIPALNTWDKAELCWELCATGCCCCIPWLQILLLSLPYACRAALVLLLQHSWEQLPSPNEAQVQGGSWSCTFGLGRWWELGCCELHQGHGEGAAGGVPVVHHRPDRCPGAHLLPGRHIPHHLLLPQVETQREKAAESTGGVSERPRKEHLPKHAGTCFIK